MQERLYIIVYSEVPAEDLTRAGIRPVGRSDRLLAIGDVADARVLEVVGVELLIVLGEVTHLDSVAEASGFEGLVPAKDPLTDGALPAGGEGAIQIEDNLLLGLSELTLSVGLLILGDELPAVCQIDGLTLVEVVGEGDLARRLIAYAGISEAGDGVGGFYGEDRIGHLSRQRHILSHGEHTHERSVHGEVHLDTDAGVGVKGLQPPDEGQAAIAGRGDLEGTLLRGDDLEEGAGLRDERIDLQDDSGAISLVHLGGEGLYRLVAVVQLECLLQLGRSVTAIDDGVGCLHDDDAILLLEAEDDRSRVHRADSQIIGVGGRGDLGTHHQLLAEVLRGELEVDATIDLVEGNELPAGGLDLLVLEELRVLVFFFLLLLGVVTEGARRES